MNELKLIDWIRGKSRSSREVMVNIGDDAAAVMSRSTKPWVYKADMIVEGVHFKSSSSESSWGWKVIQCNVSDFAAMGADPKYALVSLGMPSKFSLSRAQKIYRGIRQASHKWGIQIIGGDTTQSRRVILSVAMIGRPMTKRLITRRGAKPGDYVFVTGALGGAVHSGKHLNFVPRLRESHFLVAHYHVNAMMDISDGLANDLRLLCKESRVGAKLFEDAIPLALGSDMHAAFNEGEDFELLFTMNAKESLRLIKDKRLLKNDLHVYPIGRIVPRSKGLKIVGSNARERSMPVARSHHFQ